MSLLYLVPSHSKNNSYDNINNNININNNNNKNHNDIRSFPLTLGRKSLGRWWWMTCPCLGRTTRTPCLDCQRVASHIQSLSKTMIHINSDGVLQIDESNCKNQHLIRINGRELFQQTQQQQTQQQKDDDDALFKDTTTTTTTTTTSQPTVVSLKEGDVLTIGRFASLSWMTFHVQQKRMVTPDTTTTTTATTTTTKENRKRNNLFMKKCIMKNLCNSNITTKPRTTIQPRITPRVAREHNETTTTKTTTTTTTKGIDLNTWLEEEKDAVQLGEEVKEKVVSLRVSRHQISTRQGHVRRKYNTINDDDGDEDDGDNGGPLSIPCSMKTSLSSQRSLFHSTTTCSNKRNLCSDTLPNNTCQSRTIGTSSLTSSSSSSSQQRRRKRRHQFTALSTEEDIGQTMIPTKRNIFLPYTPKKNTKRTKKHWIIQEEEKNKEENKEDDENEVVVVVTETNDEPTPAATAAAVMVQPDPPQRTTHHTSSCGDGHDDGHDGAHVHCNNDVIADGVDDESSPKKHLSTQVGRSLSPCSVRQDTLLSLPECPTYHDDSPSNNMHPSQQQPPPPPQQQQQQCVTEIPNVNLPPTDEYHTDPQMNDDDNDDDVLSDEKNRIDPNNVKFATELTTNDWNELARNTTTSTTTGCGAVRQSLANLIVAQRRERNNSDWLPLMLEDTIVEMGNVQQKSTIH